MLGVVPGDGPARPGRERRPEEQLPGVARCRRRASPSGSRWPTSWLSDHGAAGVGRAGRAQRGVGAPVEAEPAGLRPRPPAAARGADRQDGPVPAASGPRDLRLDRVGRPPDRAERGARRPGAPVGLQARAALGVGALQRLHRRRTASRGPARSWTASASSCRASGATIGPNTPVVARIGGRDLLLDRPAARRRATRASSS